ncbi:MAG TPA: hypothetical protein VFG54_20310, partial [Prolixibacteraceae bacterium]|nr:hypothetical protein [Prolixibacteraceae bacterium]
NQSINQSIMENQKSQGLESIKPFDEEEYFVLSSEYVAMEDEYVLWKEEEVNLRQHKKSVKETDIAEYDEKEMFISLEENSYSLEESFSI